jgi:hypothetical protein
VTDTDEPGYVTVAKPLVWGEMAHIPVLAANQILIQVSSLGTTDNQEAVFTVG